MRKNSVGNFRTNSQLRRDVLALVLKRTPFGESDWILQVLTQSHGKISLLARGARKSVKRFGGGVLEPTHCIRMQYKASTRADGLGVLQEAQLVECFPGLRASYEKLNLSLLIVDAARKVAQENDPQGEALYDLLGNALKGLEGVENHGNFFVHFILKLLFQQGVLDFEPWMEPWLQVSIRNHFDLKVQAPREAQFQLESQLQNYFHRAETF